MDEKQLASTKARARRIENQIGTLAEKQRELETTLAKDHADIRDAAGRRGNLLAGLVDASGESAAKLHRELDALDAAIRVSERMAEGRQKLLHTSGDEQQALSNELRNLQEQIATAETAAAYEAWKVQTQQAFRSAHERLDDARAGLGELSTLLVDGSGRFHGPAVAFYQTLLEELSLRQRNAERFGWRFAPTTGDPGSFVIAPMVRG